MSSLFPTRSNSGDSWFRMGRLEVTSTMLVVVVVVATWLVAVVFPGLPDAFAYTPQWVGAGEVWRLVTWPLASGIGFWPALTLFFFWYFGTDLEHAIGRKPMAWLLVGVWASITLAATIVGLAFGGGVELAGVNLIEFALLLIWIAEYPDRKFLFNVPAWVFGLVMIAIQVMQALTFRDFGGLLSLLLSLVFIAVAARWVGLLTSYPWIPGGRQPRQQTYQPKASKPSRAQAKASARYTSDRDRLDALLDQINEQGLNSLSPAQRKELMRLRERLRRP